MTTETIIHKIVRVMKPLNPEDGRGYISERDVEFRLIEYTKVNKKTNETKTARRWDAVVQSVFEGATIEIVGSATKPEAALTAMLKKLHSNHPDGDASDYQAFAYDDADFAAAKAAVEEKKKEFNLSDEIKDADGNVSTVGDIIQSIANDAETQSSAQTKNREAAIHLSRSLYILMKEVCGGSPAELKRLLKQGMGANMEHQVKELMEQKGAGAIREATLMGQMSEPELDATPIGITSGKGIDLMRVQSTKPMVEAAARMYMTEADVEVPLPVFIDDKPGLDDVGAERIIRSIARLTSYFNVVAAHDMELEALLDAVDESAKMAHAKFLAQGGRLYGAGGSEGDERKRIFAMVHVSSMGGTLTTSNALEKHLNSVLDYREAKSKGDAEKADKIEKSWRDVKQFPIFAWAVGAILSEQAANAKAEDAREIEGIVDDEENAVVKAAPRKAFASLDHAQQVAEVLRLFKHVEHDRAVEVLKDALRIKRDAEPPKPQH